MSSDTSPRRLRSHGKQLTHADLHLSTSEQHISTTQSSSSSTQAQALDSVSIPPTELATPTRQASPPPPSLKGSTSPFSPIEAEITQQNLDYDFDNQDPDIDSEVSFKSTLYTEADASVEIDQGGLSTHIAPHKPRRSRSTSRTPRHSPTPRTPSPQVAATAEDAPLQNTTSQSTQHSRSPSGTPRDSSLPRSPIPQPSSKSPSPSPHTVAQRPSSPVGSLSTDTKRAGSQTPPPSPTTHTQPVTTTHPHILPSNTTVHTDSHTITSTCNPTTTVNSDEVLLYGTYPLLKTTSCPSLNIQQLFSSPDNVDSFPRPNTPFLRSTHNSPSPRSRQTQRSRSASPAAPEQPQQLQPPFQVPVETDTQPTASDATHTALATPLDPLLPVTENIQVDLIQSPPLKPITTSTNTSSTPSITVISTTTIK